MKSFLRYLLIYRLIDVAIAIILIGLLHACELTGNQTARQQKTNSTPVAKKL